MTRVPAAGWITQTAFRFARCGRIEYRSGERFSQGKERAIFTKDMSITEAIQADPRARGIFEAVGIDCVGCSGVSLESIEVGAKMYGVDLDMLLADLNRLVAAEGLQGE